MTVVLSGHGGFDTKTNPPWVTVPNGATIYFYTDNLKALLDPIGGAIESMSAALKQANPSQVVNAGESCPNYTLYPPDGLNILDSPGDVDQYTANGPVTLSEMIANGIITGDVYWAACRVVSLQEAGGALIGANASQTDFGNEGGSTGWAMDSQSPEVKAAAQWVDAFWQLDQEGRMQAFNDLPSGYKRIYSDAVPQLATWARQNGFIV
jgi:hypothetical protein